MRVDCSVEAFLCDRLQVDPAYVDERISTIFLDGQPVDDIKTAVIRDGSVLALSGAMPGLVGAVMRRGSFYASFRDSITRRSENGKNGAVMGTVRVKLFNMVLKELGPHLLELAHRLDGEEDAG